MQSFGLACVFVYYEYMQHFSDTRIKYDIQTVEVCFSCICLICLFCVECIFPKKLRSSIFFIKIEKEKENLCIHHFLGWCTLHYYSKTHILSKFPRHKYSYQVVDNGISKGSIIFMYITCPCFALRLIPPTTDKALFRHQMFDSALFSPKYFPSLEGVATTKAAPESGSRVAHNEQGIRVTSSDCICTFSYTHTVTVWGEWTEHPTPPQAHLWFKFNTWPVPSTECLLSAIFRMSQHMLGNQSFVLTPLCFPRACSHANESHSGAHAKRCARVQRRARQVDGLLSRWVRLLNSNTQILW